MRKVCVHKRGACSKGLTIDAIDSISQIYYLDEELLPHTDKVVWTEPASFNAPWISYCLWDVQEGWRTYWHYDLGKLLAGTYELVMDLTYNFPIVDGMDLDQNGEIDVFEGESSYSSTLQVVEGACP
jgi:hypothetical protein